MRKHRINVGDLIRSLRGSRQKLGVVLQVHRTKYKKTQVTVMFPLENRMRKGLASWYEVVSEAKNV